MKSVTIIIGDKGTGKSTLAVNMCKGSFMKADPSNINGWRERAEELDAKYLIFDEINLRELPSLLEEIDAYETYFESGREFIIISKDISRDDALKNFKNIRLISIDTL